MQDIGNLNWQYPVADNLLKGINVQNFPKFNALNNLFNPQSKIENTTGVKFKPSINGSPSQTYLGNTDFSNMVSQNWKSLNPAQQRMLSGTANFFDTGVGKITGSAISGVTSLATDKLTDELFGDSQFASLMGNIFSRGSHAAIDTMTNNLIKGNSLTEGLKQNVGDSVSGAVAGIAGNLVGQGINALGGDSKLSRGIGQGISTGIGMVGANALSNVLKGEKAFKGISDSIKAIKTAKQVGSAASDVMKLANAGKWNLVGIGGQVLGSGLLAAFGPSKEYAGKYGNITQTMDTIYDLASAIAGTMGPIGMGVSGLMTLNKGLSNVFGSTDGMTKTDAILGSAFMPAPVKWLNMWGSSKTGTFNNQSWQNTERTNAFMENAFGNLSKRFDLARNEAGKTYGTFSKSARKKAQRNLDFANNAWNTILAMTDLDELQRIRSLSMSSINNQRYALMIQGGFDPIYRGKQGMKIFNNATNHNIGMRLLSGAALIDDKQMILSALGGMAVPKRAKRNKYRDETDEPSMLELWKNETLEETLEEERHNTKLLQRAQEEHEREMAARKAEGEAKQKEREQKFAEKRARLDAANTRFHRSADLVQTALLQSATPPFTGKDYQEAAEAQRQEKVEKFHEAEKIAEATLMADLAVNTAPLLLRGFRWAFNKAGLLVRVPVLKTISEVPSTIKVIPSKEGYIESPRDITSDIGELIGEGSERTVYSSRSNPNIVYKIEDGNAYLDDINNIEIRLEIQDNIIAPETTIGYYKHPNGKYYRVTLLDKYKSFNPDTYEIDLSPELNLEIINTLEKAGWKVEIVNGAAKTASKNGKILRNLEHYNWGRDSQGNLKLIDLDVIDLKITPENAASITPEQWTAAQDAAIARGNMAEAQRLRDLHYKIKSGKDNKIINLFRGDKKRYNSFEETDSGYWGTTDKDYAMNYTKDYHLWDNLEKPGTYIYEFDNGNPENMRKLYGNYRTSYKAKGYIDSDEVKELRDRGIRDDVIIGHDFPLKGARFGDIVKNWTESKGIEYSFKSPKVLKSADAVTFDDKGVRIPLGERDNFNINDNRYSWLPWFLGGSTAATLYNKSK